MKILVLTSRFPYPIEKGDKLRVFHQIRELSRQHEIVLCALSDIPVEDSEYAEMEQYCSTIYLLPLRKWKIAGRLLGFPMSPLPLQANYFFNPGHCKILEEIIETEQPDHIYCQLIRMAAYLKGNPIPATLDYMDTFSVGMERRAEKASGLIRPFLKWEARRIRNWEQRVFSWFRYHTIISKQDRDALVIPQKDRIVVVPNGVDTDYFEPRSDVTPEFDLVFVGNMGYHPNIIAARFLVETVMPLVWQQQPEVRLLLAGARPSREVQALAGDRVSVSGWVEDIRDAYSMGKVFVAPLFSGSGQQNKILEAMAMGIPCITTPLVNNAIEAESEKEVILADSADQFAGQIIRLLQDSTLRDTLSRAGRRRVSTHFSWESSAQLLSALWEGEESGVG